MNRSRTFRCLFTTLLLFPAQGASAEDSRFNMLPTGEITGATEGQGKIRVALSWRGFVGQTKKSIKEGKEPKNLDLIVSPSVDVAAKDGASLLFAGGGNAPTASRPLNLGFTVSLVKWETAGFKAVRESQRGEIEKVVIEQAHACIKKCADTIHSENKAFCEAHIRDPERAAVLGALAAVEQRQTESRWKVEAKDLKALTPAEVESDLKLIERALAFHRSAHDDVNLTSKRWNTKTQEAPPGAPPGAEKLKPPSPERKSEEMELQKVMAWRKDLEAPQPNAPVPQPPSSPGTALPEASVAGAGAPEAAVAAVAQPAVKETKEPSKTEESLLLAKRAEIAAAGLAAILKLVRSVVPYDHNAVFKKEELCPSGKTNVDAMGPKMSPGWAHEPLIVSLGVRAGFGKLAWYELSDDLLTKREGRAVPVHGVLSFGYLVPRKGGASLDEVKADRPRTAVLEGVFGVGRGITPSTQEIKWCTDAGEVQVEGPTTTSAPAQQCSSGVLGKPTTTNRVFLGLFAGGVWTESGAFKAEVGPAVEYRWARNDPLVRAIDLSLNAPISMNLGDKAWKERVKYNGVVRLVPSVRLSWRQDAQRDAFATPTATFLLTLQLLGQRAFWGDALSWL